LAGWRLGAQPALQLEWPWRRWPWRVETTHALAGDGREGLMRVGRAQHLRFLDLLVHPLHFAVDRLFQLNATCGVRSDMSRCRRSPRSAKPRKGKRVIHGQSERAGRCARIVRMVGVHVGGKRREPVPAQSMRADLQRSRSMLVLCCPIGRSGPCQFGDRASWRAQA
jgi:hypothetical protein